MQKWEYRTVLAQIYQVHLVDGQKVQIKDAKGKSVNPSWVDYAKELGEQGWELAGVASDGQYFTAFFKRPIA